MAQPPLFYPPSLPHEKLPKKAPKKKPSSPTPEYFTPDPRVVLPTPESYSRHPSRSPVACQQYRVSYASHPHIRQRRSKVRSAGSCATPTLAHSIAVSRQPVPPPISNQLYLNGSSAIGHHLPIMLLNHAFACGCSSSSHAYTYAI